MAHELSAPFQGYASPVHVGDVVDKYRVESMLGVGAMGVVVSARHTALDQVVAIKFLVEHQFGTPEESNARFLAEARAAARIKSDHVCRVSDVGMLPNGIPYMIMEHLEGNDLEEEIVNRGQLDLVEAVDYVLQALDAIAAAHQLGIVHRDLKPANLFLARRADGSRRVKVLDFGISKATTVGKPRLTRETRSLGTPAYMPPEQIREPMGVDHRVDIWALGAILYELITGQMAFVGTTIKEVLDRVLAEDPCPIGALRRDVPDPLVQAIAHALVRDRDARWQSAATFARAISPFGSIGVVSGLASIQAEVGSLSSISAISAIRLTPISTPISSPVGSSRMPSSSMSATLGPHSTDPLLVSTPPREIQTQPDPHELNRRHHVVQDWTAQQARRRHVRAALLGVAGAALFLGASSLAAYRYALPRDPRPVVAVASRPSPPALVEPSPTLAAANALPPQVSSAVPPVMAPILPATTAVIAPAAGGGHPASSSVYPARSPVTKPRAAGRR